MYGKKAHISYITALQHQRKIEKPPSDVQDRKAARKMDSMAIISRKGRFVKHESKAF
jgi:hypothetical protein